MPKGGMKSGWHRVNMTSYFQYLGFQTIQKPVDISTDFATLDATLEEQALRSGRSADESR